MAKNKHKFPNAEIAREFRNHCWRHNALIGALWWARNRLGDDFTVSEPDKDDLREAVTIIEHLLKKPTLKRDDSRFTKWEI